jgi:hypothetical protein
MYKALPRISCQREGKTARICSINSPGVDRVRNGDEAGSVGVVDRVSGRVAGDRDIHQLAVAQVVGGEGLAAQELGCFDDGSRQAHLWTRELALDIHNLTRGQRGNPPTCHSIWQWKRNTPGLLALNRKTAYDLGLTETTSRMGGLLAKPLVRPG